MKCSIYVRNKKINPSSYYRIVQYFENDVEVKINSLAYDKLYEISLNGSKNNASIVKIILYFQMLLKTTFYMIRDLYDKPDVILIQRETMPRRTPCFLYVIEKRLLKRTILIWDIDDDIKEIKEISNKEFELLQSESKHIILSTHLLKSIIDKKYYDKTIVLPTTDGDVYKKYKNYNLQKRIKIFEKEVRVVWIGTTGNLKYIYNIIPYLETCAKKMSKDKKLSLTIISGQKKHFETNYLTINQVLWDRETAVKEILLSHIGLMPLEDNKFTRGKAGFKLIQYLAGGLPVIGSSIGYNCEIINQQIGYLVDESTQWEKSILCLAYSDELYKSMSENAVDYWLKNYSFEGQKLFLKKLLTSAIKNK